MLTTPSRLVSIASAISCGTADPRDRDYRLAVFRASAPGQVLVDSHLDLDRRLAAVDIEAAVDSRAPGPDAGLPGGMSAVADMVPRTFP